MDPAADALVTRFYEDIWNRWDLGSAPQVLADDLAFRGSLGRETSGRDEFLTYVRDIQAAFPDWHNRVDDMVVSGDRVCARLTWTGTHTGPLGNLPPTGNKVEYVGAGFFHIRAGRIAQAWIVGDTAAFWHCIHQQA